MPRTLIKNAQIINEGKIIDGDLLIKNDRIERIDRKLSVDGADVVDARGQWLLPGMIDDQVHFREPGLKHKGDLATESKAAAAGGITSFMEMPNTSPFASTSAILVEKLRRADSRSAVNYGFYLGATNNNLEDIKSLSPGLACGIKVFMGASTGGMLVDDPKQLEQIFKSTPYLIATHCEDTPTILANEQSARNKWGDQVPIQMHPKIRSREACLKSSTLAVSLAKQHGTRLHVLHLTTADELSLFEKGSHLGKQITVEACVHHLFFNDQQYDKRGNFIKCNPAIKTEQDRQALLAALAADQIDVVATDHAPHTFDEKSQDYLKAPAGLPLVQHALQTLIEQVRRGYLTIEQVVTKACHAPADLFGIIERGYIREGYFADLVLINPYASYEVDKEPILAKCGWTPFSGMSFSSRVEATWVNGQLLWDGSKLTSTANGGASQRLKYNQPH